MQINETNPCENIARQKGKRATEQKFLKRKNSSGAVEGQSKRWASQVCTWFLSIFFFVREMFCWAKGKFGF